MSASGIPLRKKVIILTAFSVAMGFLEAVVVVYLRQLYYPEGFSFPLKAMLPEVFSLESLREISTVIMLVCVGVITGRNFMERLAWSIYCFGIWDIFYYVWLKVLLDWPPSLMTWDILFLIPIVWSGPVLAPMICSLTMVTLAAVILIYQERGYTVTLNPAHRTFLVLGAILIVSAFVWEYAKLIVQGGFLTRLRTLGRDPAFQEAVARYAPDTFNWYFFLAGEGLMLLYVILLWKRIRKSAMRSI